MECKECNKPITSGSKTGHCRRCVKLGKKRKRFTEEHKQKIAESMKGKQTFLGKKHSEKTKEKMRVARKRLSTKVEEP